MIMLMVALLVFGGAMGWAITDAFSQGGTIALQTILVEDMEEEYELVIINGGKIVKIIDPGAMEKGTAEAYEEMKNLIKEGKLQFKVDDGVSRAYMEDEDTGATISIPLEYSALNERFEGLSGMSFSELQENGEWVSDIENGIVSSNDKWLGLLYFIVDDSPSW